MDYVKPLATLDRETHLPFAARAKRTHVGQRTAWMREHQACPTGQTPEQDEARTFCFAWRALMEELDGLDTRERCYFTGD